ERGPAAITIIRGIAEGGDYRLAGGNADSVAIRIAGRAGKHHIRAKKWDIPPASGRGPSASRAIECTGTVEKRVGSCVAAMASCNHAGAASAADGNCVGGGEVADTAAVGGGIGNRVSAAAGDRGVGASPFACGGLR